MATQYASGKHSIAECDRCGQRYKLKQLKKEIIKTKLFQIKVCPECWDPDQPQLSLGLYPVYDPQAVREPRPDVSYYASGQSGLMVNTATTGNSVTQQGYPEEGSRVIQWGWNPIGGSEANDVGLTPNYLTLQFAIGTCTISST
jgi:hypothetical protein